MGNFLFKFFRGFKFVSPRKLSTKFDEKSEAQSRFNYCYLPLFGSKESEWRIRKHLKNFNEYLREAMKTNGGENVKLCSKFPANLQRVYFSLIVE
jgi:hypothetical protein